MIVEDSEALRAWLISSLGDICDAEPGALANYIVALVKKDKDENDLYEFCLDQLDIFLLKDTKYFVDLLFHTLRTKSYLTHKPETTSMTNSKNCNSMISTVKQDVLKEKVDSDKEKICKPNSEKSTQKTFPHKGAIGSTVSVISKETNAEKHGDTSLSDDKYKTVPSSKLIKTRKPDQDRSYDKQSENNVDKSDKNSNKESITKSSHLSASVNSHSRSHSPSSPSRQKSDEVKLDTWKDNENMKKKGKNEEIQKHPVDYANSGYTPKEVPQVFKNSAYLPNNNTPGENSKRCQDYDEKGYCMRGDLCQFDHGSDPVIVEDVSILNFGVSIANVTSSDSIVGTLVPDQLIQNVTNSPMLPPPPSSPPPLPPPPPPLPPLPLSGAYIPEYNPEAPGMNITLQDHSSFWVPSNTGIHIPPPPLHNSSSQSSSVMPNIQIHHHHNTKPHRSRELIGVPTVEVTSSTSFPSDKLQRDAPALYSDVTTSGVKRKGFDFSRLGPKPKKINLDTRSTLEVRKIPRNLNNISSLNNHFSKFGKVTNIQVSYNNDPEAALIQFQNHAEAAAAYKSTEAVLNNRFIKVFWNYNNTKEKSYEITPEEPSKAAEVVPSATVSSNDVLSTNFLIEKIATDKTLPDRAVTYSAAKGNLCSTVFNPAIMKKTEVVPVGPSKGQKDDLKALYKRLELHRKKREFLETQIQSQKIMLARLGKAKNEKEKLFLKKTIQDVAGKIRTLEVDVKKSNEDLMQCLKLHNVQSSSKSEAERELLDAEMDLYNKQHKGDNTEELNSKVNELRAKAKALGILPMSTPFLEIGHKQKPKQTEMIKPSSTLLKTANHPKTPVADFKNKETFKNHFDQFGDVEKVEDTKMETAVCFNTKKNADTALLKGKEFDDQSVSLVWLPDEQKVSEPMEEDNADEDKDDSLHLLDEDGDEEEDSEARSWRR